MVKKADIDIEGLTVITGENNTGKSTVGKMIFSIYHSLNNYDKDINESKISAVSEDLFTIERLYKKSNYSDEFRNEISKILHDIIIKLRLKQINSNNIIEKLEQIINKYEGQNIETLKYLNSMKDKMSLDKDSETVKRMSLQRALENEFEYQISNLYCNDNSSVTVLEGNKKAIEFKINEDRIEEESLTINAILYKDSTYIDTPLVIDRATSLEDFEFLDMKIESHSDDLVKKLRFKEQDGDGCSTITEITNDLKKTYRKLARPFQELENIASEID